MDSHQDWEEGAPHHGHHYECCLFGNDIGNFALKHIPLIELWSGP